MTVLTICLAGNPILKKRSHEISVDEILTDKTQSLIADMFDTMSFTHGVGLAAPQVGVSQRLVVYGFDKNPRYPNETAVPFTVLINPQIIQQSDSTSLGYEGCLSLDTLRGEVERSDWIKFRAFNEQGQTIEKTVYGFEARIIQHEIDHLNGVFFVERVKNFERFGFTEILKDNDLL